MNLKKLTSTALLIFAISLISFAEGNKKTKKIKTTSKACIEKVFNEIINDDLDTFIFKQDLDIADQQFKDLYLETSSKNGFNKDLEFAEKLFFEANVKNENELSFNKDMKVANQLIQEIETKQSL